MRVVGSSNGAGPEEKSVWNFYASPRYQADAYIAAPCRVSGIPMNQQRILPFAGKGRCHDFRVVRGEVSHTPFWPDVSSFCAIGSEPGPAAANSSRRVFTEIALILGAVGSLVAAVTVFIPGP
jgi:hypothetical protein